MNYEVVYMVTDKKWNIFEDRRNSANNVEVKRDRRKADKKKDTKRK